MKIRLPLLILLVGLLAVGVTVSFTCFGLPSNCGGNSAALTDVKSIACIALLAASDAPDHSFLFAAPTPSERDQLTRLSHNHWIRNACILVTTSPVLERGTAPRRLVAVCDTAFRNVPQRRFGLAPPTHAAA